MTVIRCLILCSKFTTNRFQLGSARTRCGSLQRSPRPPAGSWEKGGKGRREGQKRKEGKDKERTGEKEGRGRKRERRGGGRRIPLRMKTLATDDGC